MSDKLLKEALNEMNEIRETAMESAKNSLLEAFSEDVKKATENITKEMVDGYVAEGDEEEENEEEVDESVFAEGEDEDLEDPSEEDPRAMHKGEKQEAKVADDEEDAEGDEEDVEVNVDEILSITEQELQDAVREALEDGLSEAMVTKGFHDPEDPNDEEGKGERGLSDKEKDKAWNEQEPPAAEDQTVKESVRLRKIIRKQNKLVEAQRNELKKYKTGVSKLRNQLQEVALLNTRLVYANKLIANENLNRKQRVAVIEAIDNATSINEVKIVYESIRNAWKSAGLLGESRKNTRRSTTIGSSASRYTPKSSSRVLNEESEKQSATYARWKELIK